MMLSHPEGVRKKMMPDRLHFKKAGEMFDAGLFGGSAVSYTRTMANKSGGCGIVGNPSHASTAKGQQIIDIVSEDLIRLVKTLPQVPR